MEMDIRLSLELHLFFARIMKEHAFFLRAGFFPKDRRWADRAEYFQMEFERVLWTAAEIGNGKISEETLEAGEFFTPFTRKAETKTMQLTGIALDGRITALEERMKVGYAGGEMPELESRVRILNKRALELVTGLIDFKESLLKEVTECRMFTANYPLLIQHILREAKLYQLFLRELVEKGTIRMQDMRRTELFWNEIMMEHALFIRGLLNPTEEALIETADDFAKEYARLSEEAKKQKGEPGGALTERTIQETVNYRNFKEAGARGILNCEITALILPLLADHVLREANHYLRLLEG